MKKKTQKKIDPKNPAKSVKAKPEFIEKVLRDLEAGVYEIDIIERYCITPELYQIAYKQCPDRFDEAKRRGEIKRTASIPIADPTDEKPHWSHFIVLEPELMEEMPLELIPLINKLCQGVLRGLDLPMACLYTGIPYEDIAPMIKRCPAVQIALNRAFAHNYAWWVDKLRNRASKGDLKATQFYLERAFPNKFGMTKLKDREGFSPIDAADNASDVRRKGVAYMAQIGKDGTIVSGDVADKDFKQMLEDLEEES